MMISSKYDRIVNIEENRRRGSKIDAVIRHLEIEDGDHLSFLVGKDMRYMLTVLDELYKRTSGIVVDEEYRKELARKMNRRIDKINFMRSSEKERAKMYKVRKYIENQAAWAVKEYSKDE